MTFMTRILRLPKKEQKKPTNLARKGFTHERIADFFSVHRDTIYEWGEKHPEFSDRLTRGKKAGIFGHHKGEFQAALKKGSLNFRSP